MTIALGQTWGNVKALRAFRVLRPLRLVSGVPSMLFLVFYELYIIIRNCVISDIFLLRSSGRVELDSQSDASVVPYCTSCRVRSYNLCHYWLGVIPWKDAPNLL